MADYRDVVLADTAVDYQRALERIKTLESDVVRYRELALAAIEALRTVTLKHDAWRERYRALANEYRGWREERLMRAGVDV